MSFTEERLPSGNSAINRIGGDRWRSVECCSDSGPNLVFPPRQDFWSSARVTIRFLVTSLTKALLPQLLKFGWTASSKKRTGCSKLLQFKNGQCALVNPQYSRIISVAFRRSVPQLNPVSALCRQFLRPHGLVFALICISAARPHIDRCVPFQIMSN